MLGEMEVQATKSKKSTPAMAIVLAYWGRLRGEIEQFLTCGENVFSPDHPSYSKFFLLASLARLMFLEHTVRFFVTETEFNWGTVWRYMCVWSENHLYRVHLESGAPFDRQLLAASVDRWAEERMTAIAKDTIKMLNLEDARKMQTGVGRLAAAAQQGGGGVAAAEAAVAASLATYGRSRVPQGPPQQPAGR